MKLKKLKIDGYKKFSNQTINFESDTTILAGANNSGKTSVSDLLGIVFGGTQRFGIEDFNNADLHAWASAALETGGDSIGKWLHSEESSILEPKIEIHCQVDYIPGQDSIQLFADYLMDLNPEKNSFYFIYKFHLDKEKLQKNIDEGLQDQISEEISQLATVGQELDGDSETATKTAQFIETRRESIRQRLMGVFASSCTTSVSFCDESYSTQISMKENSFQGLFSYRLIKAHRQLDDVTEDKRQALSKKLVSVASTTDLTPIW